MSQDSKSHTGNSSAPSVFYQIDEDQPSLGDLILSLWRNRSVIVVYSLITLFLAALLFLGLYLFQEKYLITSQQFKIEFEGIDKNHYPSGMKFSTADILSTPVLKSVYQKKKLNDILEFHEFKSALSITQTNKTLEFLEYEFAAKLSDKKISIEERNKFEALFLEKKNNALIPEYKLSLRTNNSIKFPSKRLRAEILSDILATWANDADRNKGANKYQIFLISPNSLDKETLQREDYVISTDILRTNIRRLRNDINKVMKIPGSSTIRVESADISMQDLAYRLEDLQNFRLKQMTGLLRETNASRDRTGSASYLKSKIFELELEKKRSEEIMAVYQDSLQKYMTEEAVHSDSLTTRGKNSAGSSNQAMGRDVVGLIPQFSGSFLDNLQKMNEKNSDNIYRQKITDDATKSGLNVVEIDKELRWYKEFLSKITATSNPGLSSDKSSKRLDQLFEETYGILLQTINDLNTIYLKLSIHNLNPASVLYTQTEPALHKKESAMSLKKSALIAVLFLLIAEGIIFLTILTKEGLRKKKEEQED